MKWDTRQMAGRAASVATIWGVAKLLASPRGRELSARFDRKVTRAQRATARSLARRSRNVSRHRGWLAAAVASFAVGAVFLSRAASKE